MFMISKRSLVASVLLSLALAGPALARKVVSLGTAYSQDRSQVLELTTVEDRNASGSPVWSYELEARNGDKRVELIKLTRDEAMKLGKDYYQIRDNVNRMGSRDSEDLEGAKGLTIHGYGSGREPGMDISIGDSFKITIQCGPRGVRSPMTEAMDRLFSSLPKAIYKPK